MKRALSDIAIAFKPCTGEVYKPFKEYLLSFNKTPDEYKKGILLKLDQATNYILGDIEKLINKSFLNIISTDLLIKKGYFSWAFITSYYSTFFTIQSLNRLQLEFYLYAGQSYFFKPKNIVNNEYYIEYSQEKDTHKREFNLFEKNYIKHPTKGKNRFWNIALSGYKYGFEPKIRNTINYAITNEIYDEVEFNKEDFLKIIKENKKSPFDQSDEFRNYARSHFQIAVARFKMAIDILNYLANKNIEYKSYYIRNMKRRINAINEKYSQISEWLKNYLYEWFQFFEDEEAEEKIEIRKK